MENRAPAVVAVVVTTGPGPGLEATLASLVAQDYSELSVLVVANGDATGVSERVASVDPRAFVKVLEENRGFGAACNEGARLVEGAAFFLFCHDDVRLHPDVVSRLVESAYRTNAGIVTPKAVDYDDEMVLVHVGQNADRFGVVRDRIERGEVDHGQQDLERDVFVAPGGVTLVRADLFGALRGFDPAISLLGEDLDLCWRAQSAGARIVVAPLAAVAHRESIVRGERACAALGTRHASRAALRRRHQLLVVASGWHRRTALWVLAQLVVLDLAETVVALVGADTERVGAIAHSWAWLLVQRRRVRARRKELERLRVLSDAELARLQVAGASRAREFVVRLVREGFDRARGIVAPSPAASLEDDHSVGFAAAFSEQEEFDDFVEPAPVARPSRLLTSFRSQALVVALAAALWAIGARNLVAGHLPLVGRLAPLDSWWSTWRHYFASWSPAGVGTGAPGLPGFGVLGVAGTVVLGRMGILARAALIFAVPMGALGMGRLLRDKVSNRARLIGALAYAAVPTGLNMVAQGRLDVLVAVAGLPFVARRVFEVMDVPGFRRRPYGAPVPFGHRGWRTSEAGQRLMLVMQSALVCALAPAALVAVALLIVGVAVARWFEPDPESGFARPFRLLGFVAFNVAVFLLPLTVDVAIAGRRAPEVFGLARGPWTVPGFSYLLRGVDGSFGTSWWGWLLPGAAALAVTLCRGERRAVASKLVVVATLTLALAALSGHHWLGSFEPDLDVLLALYGVCLAGLVGLGVGALESDLRAAGFGWRQGAAALTVGVLVLAAVPFLGAMGSGRFDLPTSSVAESLSRLAPSSAGGYRVLWLGDPSVLPTPGWTVAPGLALATSTNGLPGGATAFTGPDSGATDALIEAVQSALRGQTVDLGALLAPAGISTIVVLDAAAPEVAGVQQVPRRPVPRALTRALARQGDLSLELTTSSTQVYANSLFHGVVAESTPGSTALRPVFSARRLAGPLEPGGTVVAGLAPAGAFALVVDGRATARTTQGTWTPFYAVPAGSGTATGELVVRQFPLNGLLALFTLGLWAIVALGFGWIQRAEWLFTGRVGRRARPR